MLDALALATRGLFWRVVAGDDLVDSKPERAIYRMRASLAFFGIACRN